MALARLCTCAVSPEPLLFVHAQYLPRISVRQRAWDFGLMNKWACAFECTKSKYTFSHVLAWCGSFLSCHKTYYFFQNTSVFIAHLIYGATTVLNEFNFEGN